jgi:hypothetical protein
MKEARLRLSFAHDCCTTKRVDGCRWGLCDLDVKPEEGGMFRVGKGGLWWCCWDAENIHL